MSGGGGFAALFRERISSPWALQLTWAKRAFLKRSFALIAPTGVGKTTFGLVMGAFPPSTRTSSFPQGFLVDGLSRRLGDIAPGKGVLGFTGRAAERRRIEKGDLDILVTTSAFLQRNQELLLEAFADGPEIFVFVEDVDPRLKASRNVLSLLGFSPEDRSSAWGRGVGEGPQRGIGGSSSPRGSDGTAWRRRWMP